MREFIDWLEVVNHFTVIGGVAWAVYQWPRSQRRREAAEREQSYAALNDHFLKFLELQLHAPGLGTSAGDRERVWENLSPREQQQQRVLFDFLSSILERAYYFLHPDGERQEPWEAGEWLTWQHWLERYADNPNFKAFWRHLHEVGDTASYGREFVRRVHALLGLGTS